MKRRVYRSLTLTSESDCILEYEEIRDPVAPRFSLPSFMKKSNTFEFLLSTAISFTNEASLLAYPVKINRARVEDTSRRIDTKNTGRIIHISKYTSRTDPRPKLFYVKRNCIYAARDRAAATRVGNRRVERNSQKRKNLFAVNNENLRADIEPGGADPRWRRTRERVSRGLASPPFVSPSRFVSPT